MFSGFGLSFFRAATQPKKAEGGDVSKDGGSGEASKGSGESASASAKKEGESSADAAKPQAEEDKEDEEGEEGEVEDDRRTLRGNEKGAEGTIQQNGDGHVVDVSSS